STVWITNRLCRRVAPSTPSIRARRVFTRPGSGALVRMAMPTDSVLTRGVTIASRQCCRLGPQEIGEPQTPHQHDRTPDAMVFPPPARGGGAVREADGTRHPLERAGKRDVLHQRDGGKAADSLKSVACQEHRLIAGGNPGEPGAPVHGGGDDGQ